MTPEAIDSAMDQLLPPPVATSFSPKTYWGDDPEWLGAVIDYEFAGADRDDVHDALAMLEQWMTPAEHNAVVGELTKLRLAVTTRKEDEETIAGTFATFAELIDQERYPIDVVRQARLDSVSVNRFWPSWADFKQHCDGHFLKRKAYYTALRRYLASAADE